MREVGLRRSKAKTGVHVGVTYRLYRVSVKGDTNKIYYFLSL